MLLRRGRVALWQHLEHAATGSESQHKARQVVPGVVAFHSKRFFSNERAGSIQSFLDENGFEYRLVGEEFVVRECPFCHPIKGLTSNMWKLNINRNAGIFYCFRCQAKGKWSDFSGEALSENHYEAYEPMKQTTKLVYNAMSEQTALSYERAMDNNLLKHLDTTRGITAFTARQYRIGKAIKPFLNDHEKWEQRVCWTFPLIAAPGEFDHRTPIGDYNSNPQLWERSLEVQRIKIRDINKKGNQRIEPSKSAPGLFGWHLVPRHLKTLVVTEGEFDAMAVYQSTGWPAVSLPNGCNSIPPELVGPLGRFESILLWIDNDEAGKKALPRIGELFGSSRCKMVNSEEKDANEALQKSANIPRYLENATPLLAQ